MPVPGIFLSYTEEGKRTIPNKEEGSRMIDKRIFSYEMPKMPKVS
jgi:hypothetical protein